MKGVAEGGRRMKSEENSCRTVFMYLVADEIVTECSKAHFCLIFLLLVKLK